jgi:hypothetical protein
LLGRSATTETTPPTLFALVIFEIGDCGPPIVLPA